MTEHAAFTQALSRPDQAAEHRSRDPVTSVLVVDDDPDVRDLVRYKLEQSGYDVRVASDGEQALQCVAEQTPDVALLDVMMPGLSGLEVLERWRDAGGTTASMPVLMLTAKAQEADIERGFELGVDDYIVKPFSPRELARRVGAVLARASR